jgi:hypothetical protein
MKVLAWVGLIGTLILATRRSIFGGDGSVIRGIGNSGNRIGIDPVTDQLAAAIADHPGTALVTDDILAETFEAIRDRAVKGDIEAALVLFKVADRQRASSRD